ncbi:MAG: chloride channel protein, partial [Myxococcota bacterium]
LPVDRAQRVGRLLLLCALVGVMGGLAAILFEYLVEFTQGYALVGLAGYIPGEGHQQPGFEGAVPPLNVWILAGLPIAGGLIGGLMSAYLAPETEGHGTDGAIDAFHNRNGRLRLRVPFVKTLASTITIGCGGSAGKEGPIAMIGAALGSLTAKSLGLSVQERRMLLVAGIAAGVGAMFRAPLAAALFAAEVLYREMDMEFEVIVPSVISSIVGFSVFTVAFGTGQLLDMPQFVFDDPRQLLPYTALALVVAVGSRFYARIFHRVRDMFTALRTPDFVKPVLGGALVGGFAFFLPEAMASGYGVVQAALSGQVSTSFLLAVAGGKVLATALTVGSGQSGGVFGPAIVIGGLLGGAVGQLFVQYLPEISGPPGAFVVVGMAGFFAGAANTPISTVIMVSEITGNYALLVPTMWVCTLAFLLVRRTSLYESQVDARPDSPVHRGEMMGEVLERLTVGDALRDRDHEPMVTVRPHTSLKEITQKFVETRHTSFPVVTDEGRLLGVVDERALREAIGTEGLAPVVVASDLIAPAPRLVMSESLQSAMHKMVTSKHDELVVVDERERVWVEGTLSRRDLIAAYDHQIDPDLAEPVSRPIWVDYWRRQRASSTLEDMTLHTEMRLDQSPSTRSVSKRSVSNRSGTASSDAPPAE